MPYIPKNWIINAKNEDKIFRILSMLDEDVKDENSYTAEEAEDELRHLGETILADKIKENQIYFGA